MKLSADRLRRMTLARQFPAIRARGRAGVLELFRRLGPIQSQAPRAPFLTASSRLPWIRYETVRNAFADWQLLKTTNLRGTVHTSVHDHFGLLDAAMRPIRARDLTRELKLARTDAPSLTAEIESYCSDWRTRDDLLDHVRSWLAREDPGSARGDLDRGMPANLLWGHSGLIRKPRDDRWEKRTDVYHRTADQLVPGLQRPEQQEAITRLARVHLGSYGPATARDIAWWIGCRIGAVTKALAQLGPELVHHTGPDGEDLVDLAELPDRRAADPGLRLLPEFDGLLLGYAPINRGRFLDLDQLDKIWTRANGLFLNAVLQDGQIVGAWRTEPGSKASSTVIEVRPFSKRQPLRVDQLDEPVADAARVLELRIADVRVRE
jgi:hypothetical protein